VACTQPGELGPVTEIGSGSKGFETAFLGILFRGCRTATYEGPAMGAWRRHDCPDEMWPTATVGVGHTRDEIPHHPAGALREA
jgi:hypothetical protein